MKDINYIPKKDTAYLVMIVEFDMADEDNELTKSEVKEHVSDLVDNATCWGLVSVARLYFPEIVLPSETEDFA